MSAVITSPSASVTHLGEPFQFPPQNFGYTLSIYSSVVLTVSGQVPPAVSQPARSDITLRAAIDEVLAAKKAAGLRDKSIKTLRWILNLFAQGRERVPLASIGVGDIESWLATRNYKASTRQSSVGRLSALFSYHVRRDNIALNPCRKLERIKVEHTAPIILTPEQAVKLLKITPDKFRPYVVLGMFAGIRPEELLKLTWEDVCLETKTVRVNLAKTRRRRIVPLEPCAVSLLAACPSKVGSIAPANVTVRRFKRMAAEALGFPNWPHDLLRHTAASYLLALLGDAGKVAARLGNSSSILLTHYHQPVTKLDCEKFWQLSNVPAVPKLPPAPKYDRAKIAAFYKSCKSYKKTRERFQISSAGTLHYILKKKARRHVAAALSRAQ